MGTDFHLLAAFQTDILQLYVAFVLVKLSIPTKDRHNEILNRDVPLVQQIRADIAMRQYLSVKHSAGSVLEMQDAFKTY